MKARVPAAAVAKKLLIEVEHGLRNIMLMPPQLLDAPAYWEAIARVLPQAEAMVRDTETLTRTLTRHP